MICPNCGNENQDSNGHCEYCGTVIKAEQQPAAVPDNQQSATYIAPVITVSSSGRWVAFVLCLLFGLLGVHHFYVGKMGMGILYLFTGGLCLIGWIVDLILIACGSFKDKYGYVLKQ